jgi:hypothetical protein
VTSKQEEKIRDTMRRIGFTPEGAEKFLGFLKAVLNGSD